MRNRTDVSAVSGKKCARCGFDFEAGETFTERKHFGRTIYRHVKCQEEVTEVNRKHFAGELEPRGEPGSIDLGSGFSECTAKYFSRCSFGCRGPIKKGSRIIWKRGTRITWHPRCWRAKGSYMEEEKE